MSKRSGYKKSLKGKRVLVTCGPTWVAIDHMRVISNRSSGKLGQLVARELKEKGADVTLLEGSVEIPLNRRGIGIVKFKFYDDLLAKLKALLVKKFDVVVHAAAVSDYQLKRPARKKISSGRKTLRLELVPTKKIITLIKRFAPKTLLVGFKHEATVNAKILRRITQRLFAESKCDLVVANADSQGGYKAFIVGPDFKVIRAAHSRASLAKGLTKTLCERT